MDAREEVDDRLALVLLREGGQQVSGHRIGRQGTNQLPDNKDIYIYIYIHTHTHIERERVRTESVDSAPVRTIMKVSSSQLNPVSVSLRSAW